MDNPVLNSDEKWKNIDTHPMYQVSNLGRVRNRRGLIMKPWIINSGYYVLKLSEGGRNYTNFLIHRLVALHFIDNTNPDVLVEVNHKNGDKLNNTVTNLEWVTSSQNKKHALFSG